MLIGKSSKGPYCKVLLRKPSKCVWMLQLSHDILSILNWMFFENCMHWPKCANGLFTSMKLPRFPPPLLLFSLLLGQRSLWLKHYNLNCCVISSSLIRGRAVLLRQVIESWFPMSQDTHNALIMHKRNPPFALAWWNIKANQYRVQVHWLFLDSQTPIKCKLLSAVVNSERFDNAISLTLGYCLWHYSDLKQCRKQC